MEESILKRPRLGAVLRSASRKKQSATDAVPIDVDKIEAETTKIDTIQPTEIDAPSKLDDETEQATADLLASMKSMENIQISEEMKNDSNVVVDQEESETVPDQKPPFYLRRQPRRFVHQKPFSQGLADQATAAWLKEHFQAKPGSLVPKGFLCERYEEFCQSSQRKPMNNATLGRFIRGVFPKLETRRLGARQQSRYFYNNLGIRPTSPYISLMRQDVPSVTIRRNRPNKPSSRPNSPSNHLQESSFEHSDKSHISGNYPVNASKIPPYLPSFTQRRLTYTQFNTNSTSEPAQIEENLRIFDEEGHRYLQACALQNQEKIRELIHPSLMEMAVKEEWMTSGGLANDVQMVDVEMFLRRFRCHIGKLAALFMTYHTTAIPLELEHFWSNLCPVDQIQQNNSPELTILHWSVMQEFICKCYGYFYDNVVRLLIPNYLMPLDEHLWGILFVVAQRYYPCMEHVTRYIPVIDLRKTLLTGARAFSQYLRDILSANHDASYMSLLSMDVNNISLLGNAVTEVLQAEFLHDCAFWLEVIPLTELFTALQLFVSFADKRDVVLKWTSWIKDFLNMKIEQREKVEDKLRILRVCARDWRLFFAATEDAMMNFIGDSHLKAGFCAFANNVFTIMVNNLVGEVLGKTAVEYYIEIANRTTLPVNTEAVPAEIGQNWWPDFPLLPSAIPISMEDDAFYRTFPQLAGIVYENASSDEMDQATTITTKEST